jgi:uncharacterized membrane protein YgaE (UPF0421/DUF939 family)
MADRYPFSKGKDMEAALEESRRQLHDDQQWLARQQRKKTEKEEARALKARETEEQVEQDRRLAEELEKQHERVSIL